MREYFFLAMAGMLVIGGIGYFAWRMLVDLYYEYHLHKDVKAIKADNQRRKQRIEEENAKRLDNGCDHQFVDDVPGFPKNTCLKCGLERVKPNGFCDHLWKRSDEPIPASYCENCGRKFGGKISDGSSAFRI